MLLRLVISICGSCGGGVESAVVKRIGSPCVMPVESDERDEQGGIHGGDEFTAEVEEDVEKVGALPSYQPTRSEYNEHCVTHSPYRPWCRHCVRGRCKDNPHQKSRDRMFAQQWRQAGVQSPSQYLFQPLAFSKQISAL